MALLMTVKRFFKGPKNYSQETLNDEKLPSYFTYFIIVICILPFILNRFGIDFGSAKATFDPTLAIDQMTDHHFMFLRGAFTHALLEWTAFTTAILTVILAFSHYLIKKDPAVPIIAVALLCAGSMDAFHTLAATHLIEAAAPNKDLIPFTWALCRLFNGLICLFGVGIFLVKKDFGKKNKLYFTVAVSALLMAVAYVVIHLAAVSSSLPQMQFPNSAITRPWDIFPFFIFLLTAVAYVMLFNRQPSPFIHALIISTIPDLFVQLHMALGSSALFDNHFNIAHFLKIIAYLVPFLGLAYDHVKAYRKSEVIRIKAKSVIDTAPSAIITINHVGTIKDVNPFTQKLFGFSEDELIGKNISCLAAQPHQKNHDSYLENYRETGIEKIIGKGREVFALKKDGSSFPILLSVGKYTVDDDTFYTGIIQDMTEKTEFEKSLMRTNEELSQFSYRTSHDLKAPLVTVKGLARAICEDLEDGDYNEAKSNAKFIGKHVQKLENLVVDILDLARADLEDSEKEQIVFENVLEEIQTRLAGIYIESKVILEIHIDPEVKLYASRTRVTQVLENLISNGIKYHDPKKPSRYVRVDIQNTESSVQLIISDNGLGIPDEFKERMFTMFQRFHPDVSTGSGLGMYIVKKHLDQMKSEISFESSNVGSVFKIQIPKI